MRISKKDKDFLIKHIEGAKELIELDEVGDLLVIIEDYLIEDEIAHEDEPSKFGMILSDIYDRIDSEN